MKNQESWTEMKENSDGIFEWAQILYKISD